MNKITVLGRLTADVEMGETASGLTFCKFRLASRSKMKDRDGNYTTDFFSARHGEIKRKCLPSTRAREAR